MSPGDIPGLTAAVTSNTQLAQMLLLIGKALRAASDHLEASVRETLDTQEVIKVAGF